MRAAPPAITADQRIRKAVMKLYEQYADEISRNIDQGILRPGDRLPSVREACRSRHFSPATVLQAYRLLEDRGQIYTRPRSGYYVSANWRGFPPEPEPSRPAETSTPVNVRDLIFELLDTTKSEDFVQFGSAFPAPDLFPLTKLARALYAAARRMNPLSIYQNLPPGNPELRRLIARQYIELGCSIPTEEIVITTGALEGLNLCLQAVTRAGDLVAIESPAFYAALEAIERLGLKAVEIATSPREGMSLAALATALDRHSIKACWLMTNFQNPLGCLMPEEKKQELVKLLALHDVPLIEDDVYGELYYDRDRPKPAKTFDHKGLVMHCSSFSKCLAPGYRVGWTAPGRYAKQVERAKHMTTIATSGPIQAAIVEFLKHFGYKHHLRKLRQELQARQNQMLQAVGQKFPQGTRVTRPAGGYFLWIEMPESVNALEVYRLAMERKITVAPGQIFSPRRKFENCIRLNCGQMWSSPTEAAVTTLGGIVTALA
jgi:DNA-binding transcriptional MocR family regulator